MRLRWLDKFLRFLRSQPSVIVGPRITLSRGPDAGEHPWPLPTQRALEALEERKQEPETYEHGCTEWTTTDDGDDDG